MLPLRLWCIQLPAILLVAGLILSRPSAAAECEFEPVSSRVHVIHGAMPMCPRQAGNPVTNPAAVLTDDGVVLVDPGGSPAVAELVIDRIAEMTEAPVVAVFNSHSHGLYWLANATIAARFPEAVFYAHPRMIARLEGGEAAFWAEAILGDRNATVRIPDTAVSAGDLVNIGNVRFRMHSVGHGHTDHDLMIEVVDDELLFLGGVVVEPEVPSEGVPSDANFKGQIVQTTYALSLPVSVYVPGRGSTADKSLPIRAKRFLSTLYSGVERYYDQGFLDYEITERLKLDLIDFAEWYDFSRLGGVVSHIYLQVELDSF